ncbi:MAG: ECF transporter S component [Acidimicrobiia bacterium]|nr:ECF transporter S component [Acidimicrobiia bacterium]
MTTSRPKAVPLGKRTALTLALATAAGLIAFCWPLLVAPTTDTVGHVSDAPMVFALVLPVLIVVAVTSISEGGIDARTVAMLGVLTAVGTVVRAIGAGLAGVELIFFLVIIGGRVFGAGFGFLLGSTTILASALLTAGIGPWLPFQMLACAWVGAGAGLLPRVDGRKEIVLLSVYGFGSALAFGLMMNLWFWPYLVPDGTAASFVPGAPVLENLRRVVLFTIATSAGWDMIRAVVNVVLLVTTGPHLLRVLRRMVPSAGFGSTMHSFPQPGAVTWQSPSSVRSGHRR